MATIRVHSFPTFDAAFARDVEALVASRTTRSRDRMKPAMLQAALRKTYPNAIVSAQQSLALRGDEGGPLWYAFRDGGLASRMSAPRRVLVVDDDEAFSTMLEAMLVEAGFVVRRASDGVTGLDAAAEFAPNLIILDLAMPRSSGEEFAERYRKAPEPHAQIVVVSGVPDAWKRAQATNARAVLRKPFEMDSLLTIVRHLA